MNTLTYHCCPWRQDFPALSKTIDNEQTQSLEKSFFEGKIALDQIGKTLKGVIHLPDCSSRTVQLIHLARISEDNVYSPLTEKQEWIFDINERTDKAAERCLKCGCLFSCTAGAIALGTVGPGCIGPSWILQTIAVFSNSLASGISYISTGCYPHVASAKANEMQNTFSQVKELYLELGSHLIRIYEDFPKQAKGLAKAIDTEIVAKRAAFFLSPDEAEEIVKPLKKAKIFILTGKIPDYPLVIRNQIELALLRNEIYKK